MKSFLTVFAIAAIVSAVVIYLINIRDNDDPRIERYGKAYNPERIKNNLPIIEDDWLAHWKDSTYIYWSNPTNSVNSSSPIHLSKTLNFNGQRLISEEDVFHNEGDGKIAYKLVMEINLLISDSSKFELIKYYRRSYPPNQSWKINFDQADSILQVWNFKNLYLRRDTNPNHL